MNKKYGLTKKEMILSPIIAATGIFLTPVAAFGLLAYFVYLGIKNKDVNWDEQSGYKRNTSFIPTKSAEEWSIKQEEQSTPKNGL